MRSMFFNCILFAGSPSLVFFLGHLRWMVNITCGSHGTLMWWWQPQDPIRYNASFVTSNSYIIRIGCSVIWVTILRGLAKEELAYVQRLGLKWRPCLQGVVGMSLATTLYDAQAYGSFPNLVNDSSLGSFNDSFVVSPQVDGVDHLPPSRPNMDDSISMSNLPPWQMRQMTL